MVTIIETGSSEVYKRVVCYNNAFVGEPLYSKHVPPQLPRLVVALNGSRTVPIMMKKVFSFFQAIHQPSPTDGETRRDQLKHVRDLSRLCSRTRLFCIIIFWL